MPPTDVAGNSTEMRIAWAGVENSFYMKMNNFLLQIIKTQNFLLTRFVAQLKQKENRGQNFEHHRLRYLFGGRVFCR